MIKKLIFVALIFIPNIIFSQFRNLNTDNNHSQKTMSPYFEIITDNPEEAILPLYSTSAKVQIAGVIADVKITQVYMNKGEKPIEAIYVFPASTKAAVYGLTMKIGDRTLKAEIQEKSKARETYNQAKEEGKSASLLEQQRPNVFQMNVANIMPGDTIIVELYYTELLIPTDKNYEFIFPTVVGPRYYSKTEDETPDNDQFIKTPYKHEGEKPDYKFDIKIDLITGVPIQNIECTTHKVNIDKIEKNEYKIYLDDSETYSGNKDFVLKYSLFGNMIETGLLLSQNNDENFFLLMLQPPKRIDNIYIPPREYIFVIDVSGSMHGFPLNTAKSLIKKLLNNLNPNEKFNIIFFSGASFFLFEQSQFATSTNIEQAIKVLDEQQGGGGTELLPALEKVFKYPKDENYSRIISIITDGYVAVEKETFKLIKNNLDDANVFAFGIGNGVNRYIIEGIARTGQGEPFVVMNKDEADSISEKFRNYINSPIMTNIKFELDGFEAYDIEPEKIPDVFADRPIIIYGKWSGNRYGNIKVSGIYNNKRYFVNVNVLKFGKLAQGDALKYLWARNKVATLSDFNGQYNFNRNDSVLAKEITELGLKYNLLTDYTSFVAVDYIKRNDGNIIKTVKQPLPLPQGVSDYAIGGAGIMSRTSFSGILPSVPITESYDKGNNNNEVSIPPFTDINQIQANLKYPEDARLKGIEGKVIVRAKINEFGKIVKTEIAYSDSQLLDSAALDAIKSSKFIPAQKNGQPISEWITIPIEFKLHPNNFQIKTIKNGKGKAIKKGDKVTFEWYLTFESTGREKPTKNKITYKYLQDNNYKIIDEWFDNMLKEEIRQITVINKKDNVRKLLKIPDNIKNIQIEIRLLNIE